ncbi:MAG: anti-sigma F factor [Clostridiales bacterium]|nr:anti-sigma F factor [Clostridiales bacterium]
MEYVNQIRLEMQSCSENEALARTVAASFVAEMDPTMEELTEIRTAISEAVSNAVIHAYGGDRKGLIILEAALLSDGKVIFSVEDKGRGIEDIEKAREPLFTTGPAGERSGMGFTVMESFMDKLQVESTPGRGTRITMVKLLDRSYGF